MKRLALLAAILGALLIPATASATLHMYGDVQLRDWNWAHQAQMNVPLPNAKVWVFNGDPEYVPGIWWRGTILPAPFPSTKRSRSGELNIPFDSKTNEKLGWTVHIERGVFLHEMGHVFDFANMTQAARAQFRQLAQTNCSWWAKHCLTRRPDIGPNVIVDIPPGEMFAEEYMACALGLTRLEVDAQGFTTYGWKPPDGSEPQMCALIHSLG